MELQKEEQISINHVFDDYKSFLDYLLEHDDENKINGVSSESFLKNHDEDDLISWYEDTNEQCEEQISISHVFDDYKSFLDYLLEHDDENKINGVSSESFLKNHDEDDLISWYEDNNTNEQCEELLSNFLLKQ